MNVAHLNSNLTRGGAASAAVRLVEALSRQGFSSQLHTQESSQGNAWLKLKMYFRPRIDAFPVILYPHRNHMIFSPARLPNCVLRQTAVRTADIIHFHWIQEGFVDVEAIKNISCPIVWTLHDSWPFTGGCHLPGDCTGYKHACGYCPVLGSEKESDLSHRIWCRKQASWHRSDITIVAPSRWIANKARSSSLFRDKRIVIIPNAIDTSCFSPGDKLAARRDLGLPEHRKLLLFGANQAFSDRNKGFDLLQAAIKILGPEKCSNSEIVVFGESAGTGLPECGMPIRSLGVISEAKKMALLYRSADVFVTTSRQENLPYVVMESMACGTPCVAFQVGGIPELISHNETGFLAKPYDVGELAVRIHEILNNDNLKRSMAKNCRKWIEENVSMEKIARRHIEMYQLLINLSKQKANSCLQALH